MSYRTYVMCCIVYMLYILLYVKIVLHTISSEYFYHDIHIFLNLKGSKQFCLFFFVCLFILLYRCLVTCSFILPMNKLELNTRHSICSLIFGDRESHCMTGTQESVCLSTPIPCWVYRHVPPCQVFMSVPGIQLRSSYLQGKHFTH